MKYKPHLQMLPNANLVARNDAINLRIAFIRLEDIESRWHFQWRNKWHEYDMCTLSINTEHANTSLDILECCRCANLCRLSTTFQLNGKLQFNIEMDICRTEWKIHFIRFANHFYGYLNAHFSLLWLPYEFHSISNFALELLIKNSICASCEWEVH